MYYGQFNQPVPPNMYVPEVSREEKRSLRKNYNSIGLVLLILYVLIFAACTVCFKIFCPEVSYDENGMAIYGLADMIIGACFPAIMAILVFAGYCMITRYNPKEIINTQNVSGMETFKYVLIVLMCQQISMICTIFIATTLSMMGLEVTGLNYVLEHKPSVYAVDIFSAVILAPIGEELIYRGIVLRCSAKISQRFAIFFSAFIFGIMHGNPYQFVLGFLIGIPLALITIKTGSIIPAIICHMANNAVASVSLVVEYFNEDVSFAISWIMLPIFLIEGIVVLVSEISAGNIRIPPYTIQHKKRTLPILITSWSMIVIMIFYVYDLIRSVQPIADAALQTA